MRYLVKKRKRSVLNSEISGIKITKDRLSIELNPNQSQINNMQRYLNELVLTESQYEK